MNILIGCNSLPQYKLYWNQDDLIRNSGVTQRHTEDIKSRLSIYIYLIGIISWLRKVLIMTNYKIHPVLNIVQDSFADSYKPGQSQTIDEGMIALIGKLSCIQYLPAKPIKRGIKL